MTGMHRPELTASSGRSRRPARAEGTPERQQRVWGGQLAVSSMSHPQGLSPAEPEGESAHVPSEPCVGEPQPFLSQLKEEGV